MTVEADEDQIFSAGGIVAPGAATETVWSSTLTVGRLSVGEYGYFPVEGGDIGELPERTFVREGTNYSVENIQYRTALHFTLNDELLDRDLPNLILQVGERYFPLSGAIYFSAASNHGYEFGSDPLGWSANDEVALALLSFTHPEEPTDLRATAAGQRAVDLAWTAPEVTGSGGIAGYRIERWDDGDGSWTDLVADTEAAGTTYRDETLIPGETRDYRVSAINGKSLTGPSSVTASATSEHGVRSIEVTSTTVIGDTYLAGETIEVTATLSANAELVGASMPLSLGGGTVSAACVETAGKCLASPTVVFRHVVQVDEVDADGIAWAADAIAGTATATADASAVSLSHAASGPLGGHKVDGRALTVSVADAADVTEGAPATFEVTLLRPSGQEVEVTWSTSDGTAAAGEDYTAVAAGTLSIEAGQSSGMLMVTTLDDALNEFPETLEVRLDSASGGAAVDGAANSATVTLLDNDPIPVVTVADVSVAEGGDAVLAATLSAPSGREVVVSWVTVDATATAGVDFTAVVDGTLTFAPGETRHELTIPTLDDAIREDAESFLVRLQRQAFEDETAPAAVNATVTIEADDDRILLGGGYSAPAAATETVWSATLTVGAGASGAAGYIGADSTGVLSPTGFDSNEVDYVVAELVNQVDPNASSRLWITLNPALPVDDVTNFILRVGERYFPLRYAVGQYSFNDISLGWVAEEEVEVELLAFTHPEAPTGLRARAAGSRVDLSWAAPVVIGNKGIAGYRIERSDGGGSWTDLVANTATDETTYRDWTIGPDETRRYRVRAINGLGNTGPPSVPTSASSEHGVRSIEVTSTPAYGDIYLTGEAIEVTVTLSRDAELFGASFALSVGNARAVAACVETSGNCTAAPSAVFRYVVDEAALDEDGESLGPPMRSWAGHSVRETRPD